MEIRPFTHLHVHSQYSILDGASGIPELVNKVKADGMTSIALTDHGNLFGAKHFHDAATGAGIKPILGCETYVARTSRHDKTGKEDRSGDHLILLAKNLTGYKNLVKLVSLAYIEGYYYKPRIDKELLLQYKEGLIASSACLGGEISQLIMNESEAAAEKAVLWFKELFGDDYYIELMRHKSGNPNIDRGVYENQVKTNEVLLKLAAKHNIKVIATNDCHFINAEDAEAHDRLICLNTGKDLDDPTRMRYTTQEFVKTQQEMNVLFKDIPEAIDNTQEILNKIETYKLDSPPVMPNFPLPEGFDNPDDYLKHITYEGAKIRYPELTEEIRERIDFELETIKRMGFPGYFLIVWDFIKAAREMGVIVGPGRGSAAGSAVAYCIKITNIDPIKYDLLFERFLNPDRISMPDIDIDFDDDGRQAVLDWVVNKYGYNKVSHIITFGTMAAKMAIRDVARVQKLPLSEADRLSKLVPEGVNVSLKKAFDEVPELAQAKKSGDENVRTTLRYAQTLEGCIRHTGVHACGIIICRDDLINHIPVCTSKDTQLLITQFDGHYVEPVGMLKMDFLGLSTLTIIKEAINNINLSRKINIDIDTIPLDDPLTFKLYSNGETTGIFQFESPGMKKYLRGLKPNRFEDLVAMNALYRPGPMDYIPQFVKRKHGDEAIVYDHPLMELYLKDTYGITVYQEQVMLLARLLANFTRGQSDSLRKAMGKKNIKLMNELKAKFIEGCKANEKFMKPCNQLKKNPDELIDKIWADWESFAKYAFNKSHSVCYAYVSYQTAYLKAHYPAEFMAAVLSSSLSNIKDITTFMEESKRMGMPVLGPDVNESHLKFTVNKKGQIRFGMAAVKGVGEGVVSELIKEREDKGNFKDVFDFIERMLSRNLTKKTAEKIVLSGGFDSFGIKREQFFVEDGKGNVFLDHIYKYTANHQVQKSSTQQNLFGNGSSETYPKPVFPPFTEWPTLEKLNKEKELIGIYLSAHPLDDFKLEFQKFTNTTLAQCANPAELKGKELFMGGIITALEHKTAKNGKPFGSIVVEDYSGTHKFTFFSKDYNTFRDYMYLNTPLLIRGKVQERPFNAGELEIIVSKIDYLADMREKITNLAIKIPIQKLEEPIIHQIQDLVEKNKGNTELYFIVYDASTKMWVSFLSRKFKINVSDDLIHYLEGIPGVEYKIN